LKNVERNRHNLRSSGEGSHRFFSNSSSSHTKVSQRANIREENKEIKITVGLRNVAVNFV
jgi:hypothetical protein